MDKLDYVNWCEKAEGDLEVAKLIYEHKKERWDIACYHCQQAVEKYLKAFLIFSGQTPPRTHDLLRLITDCIPFDAKFANFQTRVDELNDYSVTTRYPSNLDEDFDEALARDAIQYAEQIIAFVKGVLP